MSSGAQAARQRALLTGDSIHGSFLTSRLPSYEGLNSLKVVFALQSHFRFPRAKVADVGHVAREGRVAVATNTLAEDLLSIALRCVFLMRLRGAAWA